MSSKILVIDDHRETLELISLVLQKQGYRVKSAYTGQEGLAVANEFGPDLILLDVMMPDMDGFTVCRTIRQTENISDVPAICSPQSHSRTKSGKGSKRGLRTTSYRQTNQRRRAQPSGQIDLSNQKKDKLRLHNRCLYGDDDVTLCPQPNDGVLRVCGGCGTTTLALNTAFAHAITDKTLLVDLDMNQGHVALYLNKKVSVGLNELAAGIPMNVGGQSRK